MGALDSTMATSVRDALLGGTQLAAVPGVKVRLMSANGSASAAGTELTGTGYTALGTACTFSGGTNTTVLSWTNGSGGAWSIAGVELWTTDATPKRIAWGALTTNPTSVPNGAVFQISASNITLSFP